MYRYLRIVGFGWRLGWRIFKVIQMGDQDFMVVIKRGNRKGVSQCFSMLVFRNIVKLCQTLDLS
jgi:hypothetical protein